MKDNNGGIEVNKIQEAINNLKGEYTFLIVAHRLSTIIDSDRIFVVEDGKIVDSGSHKELLKKSEIYKNLYNKDLANSRNAIFFDVLQFLFLYVRINFVIEYII